MLLASAEHAGSVVAAAIGLLLLYPLTIIIYRLYFHPLAAHPGPILGKITNAYSAYHAWKGDLCIDVLRCHKAYGPLVRYGPNRLLVNMPSALQDIYRNSKNVKKSEAYGALVHKNANTLTLTDKKEHSKRRRFMTAGFSEARLRDYEDVIAAQVQRLAARIERRCQEVQTTQGDAAGQSWSEPLDMAELFGHLAFDIMSNVIFDQDYNLMEKCEFRPVIPAIEDSNVRTSVLFYFPKLNVSRLLRPDKWLFPQAIRGRNVLIRFVGALLLKVFDEKNCGGAGMMHHLLRLRESASSKSLTEAEIAAEGVTLVVAGSDTTSTALAALFHYVSQSPAIRDRLAREVRCAFATADAIRTGPALNDCAFLRTCIEEALRMSPPTGGALWREVDSPAGLAISDPAVGECVIQPGCEVGTSIYALHHDPRLHANPDTFDPDRWADGGAGVREAYMPFSHGSRGCIGRSLAMHEMLLTSARLLWQFDFVPDDRQGTIAARQAKLGFTEGEFPLADHVTAAKQGPFLAFVERTQRCA